jgi:hypothetical protein
MLRAIAVLTFVCLVPTATMAHHSRAEFANGAMHEIEGEVARVVWRNPHVMLSVRTQNADGSEQIWEMEAGDAGTMARRGLTDDLIAVGDRVRAAGQRSNRRDNWLTLAHVQLESGTELVFAGGEPRWSSDYIGGSRGMQPTTEAANDSPDGIFRVWFREGRARYNVIEQPPLTPAARAAWQAYDPLRDDPVLDCVLPGMPRVMTMTGSRPIEFQRQGDDILLHSENYNRMRTIHMGVDEVPDDVAATPLGYSRGRWEGNTLVVTTTNVSWPFFELPPFYGVPQSEEIEIVERFTLGDDELTYDFWAFDPVNFTAPIEEEGFFVWRYDPNIRIRINECEPHQRPDEEN